MRMWVLLGLMGFCAVVHSQPVFTIDGKRSAVFDLAIETIEKGLVVPGPATAHGFIYPYFAPGANYGDNWWEIDSSCALEAWKWVDFDFAVQAMKNFPLVQKENGRIPLWGNDTLPSSDKHSKQIDNASALPVIFRSAYELATMKGDEAFTREMFTMCDRYLEWWMSDRLDENTGLISSLFEETFPPYLNYAGEYSGVDTCVMVALGAEWTAQLADRLGETAKAEKWRAKSAEIFAAARSRMWDAERGVFTPYWYDGGTNGFASAEGFYMFADKALDPAVKERMLASMKSERFGWDRYPLTSMATDDPTFTMTKGIREYQYNPSWCGMVWSLINRWTVHALFRAGCDDEAVTLAKKTVAMIDRAGTFDEFYAPDDGSAQGGEYYVWTAANYLTMVIEDLCGVSCKDGALVVHPRITDDFTLTGIACGTNGYFDVVQKDGRVKVTRHAKPSVEYIESTGNEYIDTGVTYFPELVTIVDIMLEEDRFRRDGAIVGAGWNERGYFLLHNQIGLCHNVGGTHVEFAAGDEWRFDERTKVTMDAKGYSINGVRHDLGDGNNEAYPVCIFWIGNNNYGFSPSSYSGIFRLYSCVMSNSVTGAVLRDFRPAVSPDGEVGLIDKVSGDFFGNKSGQGAFIAGMGLPIGFSVALR